MLPIHLSSEPLTFDKVSAMQRRQTRFDWFGAEISASPWFILAADPQKIWFMAGREAAADCDAGLKCGEFHEGLWSSDCAELFLVESGSKRYVELNLGPQGAWWGCVFSDYRVREAVLPPNAAMCFSKMSAGAWSAGLAIARDALGIRCALGPKTSANITFVAAGRYFSFAKIDSKEPDFHLIRDFEVMGH